MLPPGTICGRIVQSHENVRNDMQLFMRAVNDESVVPTIVEVTYTCIWQIVILFIHFKIMASSFFSS